jgi:anthranilate synthase component 1
VDAVNPRRLDSFPDLLALHRHAPARYPFLLESVAHGTLRARYDILFAFPGDRLWLDGAGLHATGKTVAEREFLRELDAWWQRDSSAGATDYDLPFRGGWFVYAGYELAAQIEPTVVFPDSPFALPTACAVRCPAAIIRDHERQQTLLISETGHEDLLDAMQADILAARPQTSAILDGTLVGAVHEQHDSNYLDAVRRIREYILAGDVFQVNLSRSWTAALRDTGVDAPAMHAEVYRRLRRSNPAPFAGFASFGETAIISSSPERLVHVKGDRLSTRPIAGTRPRDPRRAIDEAYSAELIAHPKERAEHIMLIDLERNDLGRVCRPGSVTVDELMTLATYAHVHHIESSVRGRLREGVTPGDVIRAVFPGGTITGCPKVRCMQIIAELEAEGRGAYTGSMGYLNLNGDLDMNILIRTITMNAQQLMMRAGAGIVADSEPEAELAETRAKARGLLLAL